MLQALIFDLMGDLRLIQSPHEILKLSLRAIEEGHKSIDITAPVTGDCLKQSFLAEGVQIIVEEQRTQNRQNRDAAKRTGRRMLEYLAKRGLTIEEIRKNDWSRSATRFIEALLKIPGFVQDWFADEIRAAGGTKTQAGRALEIVQDWELWRLYAVSHAVGIYMNTIEAKRKKGKHKPPGFNDMKQGVYLVAAGTFATEDRELRKLLKLVSIYIYGWKRKRIISYDVLRAENLP